MAVAAMLADGPVGAQAASQTPAVAIMNYSITSLPLDASSNAFSWSITGLIANRLGRTGAIAIVDRDSPATTSSGAPAGPGAARVVGVAQIAAGGKMIAADYFVMGTGLLAQNALRIETRLVSARTGIIVARVATNASLSDDISSKLDSIVDHIAKSFVSGADSAIMGANGMARPGARDDAVFSRDAAERSAGFVTLGKALELTASQRLDQAAAIAMLRQAAMQTPALARDVEEIIKRWGGGRD